MLKILELGGLLFLLIFLVLFSAFSFTDWREYLLSLVYPETVSPEQLRVEYAQRPIKILLVPGHDKEFRGAAWGGVQEEKLNLLLAQALFNFLSADAHFAVFSAREFAGGEYSPALASYFTEQRSEVETFSQNLKESFSAFIRSGELKQQADPPHHNFARPEVALRLYAINKWANDQNIDIVIHLHFNDDPERRRGQVGRYSGLAVYIPERQYPNARASAALGQTLYNTLSRYFPVSDLPQESQGIVEDQNLIAVGSRASRTGASVLVEYAYIYEPQIASPSVNQPVISEMAWQTYLGIKKYFEPAWPDSTTLLPHRFERQLSERANLLLSLTFVGDLMLDRGVRSTVEKNAGGDYGWLFTHVRPLAEADILFGNLEGPLSDQGRDLGGEYSFRMAPAALSAIKAAGFDVLSVANNHIGDWGKEAFLDTLERLEVVGIVASGGGRNYAAAAAPRLLKIKGMKIGFLSATDIGPEQLRADENEAGILFADDPDWPEIISRAAGQTDALVVSYHFGEEYQTAPSERQKFLARLAIDRGAKIVVGHHPHIVQPVERYGGGVIAYSLGNFIFDQDFSPETITGLALTVILDKEKILGIKKQKIILNQFLQPSLSN